MFSGNFSSHRSALISFGFSLSLHLLIAIVVCILSLDTTSTFLKIFGQPTVPFDADREYIDDPHFGANAITLKKLDNILPEELRELFKESQIVPVITKKIAPQPAVERSVKATKVLKQPKQRIAKPKPEPKPVSKKDAKKSILTQTIPPSSEAATTPKKEASSVKNDTKNTTPEKKLGSKHAISKEKLELKKDVVKQPTTSTSPLQSGTKGSSVAISDRKTSDNISSKQPSTSSATKNSKVSIEFIDDLTPQDQSIEIDEATTHEIYDIITTSWEPLAGWEDAGPVTIKVAPTRFGGSYGQPEFLKKSLAVAKNQQALNTVIAVISSGKVKGRTFNLTFK